MLPLPVNPFVDVIAEHLRRFRAVIVTAQPGAGKTTRIPPALTIDGPVILLQPRRVAARSIAARIAGERGWTLGREVGWQVRLERRFTDETDLLVVTEGVLTARLQSDPLLSGFRTVVFDEFHERSIHGDVAIALARQAWRARDDLRIVVMSATLDAGPVSTFLDGCPVVEVPGQLHPMTVEYAPGASVADVAAQALRKSDGDVLCFLPGAAEIRRTVNQLRPPLAAEAIDVLPLYGGLDAAAQDTAMRASPRRRVVVATNIAETSVTVPGVRTVVDSGWQKTARYDAERAIDSLDLERIAQDSADQRAGRAARLGPGSVWRLWDQRDRLRPRQEPEIQRVDLSGPLLDVIGAGWDPREFEWFEAPREDAVDRALALLERLELVQGGHITPLGREARRLPLHPRLARAFIAANGAREMARAVALLSERHSLPPRREATSSDLLSALDNWSAVPAHVQRVAQELERAGRHEDGPRNGAASLTETDFLKAVLAGYKDRLAARREPGSPRVRLSSGAGAIVGPESGVVDGEFLVALDVQASAAAPSRPGQPALGDARIRLASRVEREWLTPTSVERVHRFDAAGGCVKAMLVERYDALVLSERSVAPDPEVAAPLLAAAWLARGPLEADERVLRRVRFAGVEIDLGELVRAAAHGARTIGEITLAGGLSREVTRRIDRDAPDSIAVPSGRSVPLEYAADGSVSASVKLQELFGLAETPKIGPRHEPVLFALLAPNGRPVQLTRDLRSFWNRTYPEVRKELRGRYPRHPWPEDPWNAPPTRRATPRKRA